ncbi:hypothetical protein BZM27_54985 [Paraburkholderia steynii]|uniref:Uncharacterized protein n=1 Tax=Paraburkholderia steynii TaxID=1245441 RepID=A0A4R0WYK7_9BURK|nr:hypothetical protein BZM27_54985 [Paraburkholderia steynii]
MSDRAKGNNFEAQLLADGYLAEVEIALNETYGQEKFLGLVYRQPSWIAARKEQTEPRLYEPTAGVLGPLLTQ